MMTAFLLAGFSLAAALIQVIPNNDLVIAKVMTVSFVTLIPIIIGAALKSAWPTLPKSAITFVCLSIFLLIFKSDQFYSYLGQLIETQSINFTSYIQFLGQIISSAAIVISVLLMMVGAAQLGAHIVVPRANTDLTLIVNSLAPALVIFAVGVSLQFIGAFLNDIYLIPDKP